jgi:hypothetical protein
LCIEGSTQYKIYIIKATPKKWNSFEFVNRIHAFQKAKVKAGFYDLLICGDGGLKNITNFATVVLQKSLERGSRAWGQTI